MRRGEARGLFRRPDGGFTYERLGEDARAELVAQWWQPGTSPANVDVVQPRPHQRVPKGGAWAMVTRQLPPMERGLDRLLVVGSVVWLSHLDNADDYGFLPGGTYKAQVLFPAEVQVYPYEYSVVPFERVLLYWQEGAHEFLPAETDVARLNAVVFYARSRGIGLADATAMALGSLAGPVGWFRPVPEVAEWMAGLAGRLNRWPGLGPENHARRRAARQRRAAAGGV